MISPYKAKTNVYEHYVQDDGLVSVDRDPTHWSTQNGLMHLGLFVAMLDYLNLIEFSDQEHTVNTVSGCEKQPGLYDRDPGRPDLIAHDDLIGASAASNLTEGVERSEEILKYGIRHLFFWNNTDRFTVSAFRGFQVGFMLYLLSVNQSFMRHVFKPFAWLWFKLSNPTDYKALLNFMMLQSLSKDSEYFRKLRDEKIASKTLFQAAIDYFGHAHPLTDLAMSVEISELFSS